MYKTDSGFADAVVVRVEGTPNPRVDVILETIENLKLTPYCI